VAAVAEVVVVNNNPLKMEAEVNKVQSESGLRVKAGQGPMRIEEVMCAETKQSGIHSFPRIIPCLLMLRQSNSITGD